MRKLLVADPHGQKEEAQGVRRTAQGEDKFYSRRKNYCSSIFFFRRSGVYLDKRSNKGSEGLVG